MLSSRVESEWLVQYGSRKLEPPAATEKRSGQTFVAACAAGAATSEHSSAVASASSAARRQVAMDNFPSVASENGTHSPYRHPCRADLRGRYPRGLRSENLHRAEPQAAGPARPHERDRAAHGRPPAARGHDGDGRRGD